MSAQDMRDMMGLTGEVPRPNKKRKLVEKRPAEKGVAREVAALMGERAPPVSMIQMQPKYKQRPRRTLKVTPWTWKPFKNEARNDDLTLYHWQRQKEDKPERKEVGNEESEAPEVKTEVPTEKPYQFSKYNVQVDVPIYTDEVYESTLKDDDWSKEETDHLIELVKDYGQKWAIVWDRYDFKPTKTEDAESAPETKTRSMEDLKARYYTVRAKMLAHETPIASMNGPQYSLYQTLTHFDVKQESCRKKMTEAHLYRTDVEVQEETALLAELQRIMINQSQLEASRKEIRDRLDYPVSTSSTTQYTTSAALGQLFQQLLAADRTKKDRRLKEPLNIQTHHPHHPGAPGGHRDSLSGMPGTATTTKSGRPRDSLASATSLPSHADDRETRSRAVSPHSRDRFFISAHDKLSAGVTFASDKLAKPRVAKSTVQTERIAAVLQTLKVPDLVPLPTQRVVEAFEKLMGKVLVLLEMRKVGEREEGEIKTRLAEKGIKEGSVGAARKEGGGQEGTAKIEGESGEKEEARGQKRSASVLSEGSQGREKRRK